MSVSRQSAIRFIVALGLISLFADVTYEGARGINGPFLSTLGAGAVAIGVISGAGELAGYVLRLVSGRAADRTKRYWALIVFGYFVNLLAVPLMALAHHWLLAAALIILERAGKAVRTPSRDVLLSQASKATGRGWGFGLHEAMDQIGATTGPLLVALVIAQTHRYAPAYALLAIPAALGITTMLIARSIYPDPARFEDEPAGKDLSSNQPFPRAFWIYVTAAAFIAAGIIDYPLIAFHFAQQHVTTPAQIPIFYSAAMGIEALAALFFGWLFDRLGSVTLVAGAVLLAASNPLVFFGSFWVALLGMLCWGAGAGAINSSLRAEIANIVPSNRRGTAYGVFNTAYGIAWFAGSALAGLLYSHSIPLVVGFAVALEIIAIPFLLSVRSARA